MNYHIKCFVLIGPPASGKTTWRMKNLKIDLLTSYCPEPDAIVISGDDLIEAEMLISGDSYPVVFARHDFEEQRNILQNRLLAAISNYRDIIIDRTNLTVKSREAFLSLLPVWYEKVAIIFSVPENDLFSRLDKRAAETGKIIPHKVVSDMITSYQPPTLEEFHHIIRL